MKLSTRKGFGKTLLLTMIALLLVACDSGVAAPTATTSSGTPASTSPVPANATGTVLSGGTQAPAGNLTRVHVGYVPVMIFAPIFVAQERGYFAKEGLDVQLTPVQGGSDSVVQLAAGNFDAAVGGMGAGLLNAAARGVKFTIVAPMHSEKPPLASPLVISAKRAGEFKSVADLKGKKVSINATGAATEYWLAKALATKGLTFKDVQLQTVPFSNVPAALESGSLDAAILGEPLATINKDKGIVKVLADDFIDGFTSTYLYMGDPLLKNNPKAANGFMKAYLHACRDLQGNYMNDDVASIIEKYTKVPAGVIKRASLAQYDPNGRISLDDINTLQDYFFTRNELEYKAKLDMSRFVDTEVARQVAADLDAGK